MRLKEYTDGLDSVESLIISLARTIEARDQNTRGHCERLARYATALGEQLGLDSAQCRTLYRGGFLHDIGKIAVPDAVLLKPGPLTPAERALMQQHTVIGDSLCSELRSLHDVRPIIRHHHERADGSGYPDRLKGDAIPLLAQIMGVVDVYDALTTSRPYREALTPEEAIAELWNDVTRGWKDADLVERFAATMLRAASQPRSLASVAYL
jgi:putative two-component system response regulator